MRQNLAVLVDGVLHLANGECSRPDNAPSSAVAKIDNHVIDEPIDPMSGIASALAYVVRATQPLNTADQRRVRALVRATAAALDASTTLDAPDQKLFEASLRDANARRN